MSEEKSSPESESKGEDFVRLCRQKLREADGWTTDTLEKWFPGVPEEAKKTYQTPVGEDPPSDSHHTPRGKWVAPVPIGFVAKAEHGLLPPPAIRSAAKESGAGKLRARGKGWPGRFGSAMAKKGGKLACRVAGVFASIRKRFSD